MAATAEIVPTSAAALAAPRLALASPWSLPGNLAEVVLPDVLGIEGAAVLTRARAMRVPAVARARHILCGKIADQPLRAYRGDQLVPEDAAPAWIARSDGELSPWHRMLWTVDDVFFTGFSLWRRTNSADGDRTNPRVLQCDRVARDAWDFDERGRVCLWRRTSRGDELQQVSETEYHLIVGPHEGLLSFGADAIRHAANLQDASDKAARTPAAQIDLHQTAGDPLTDPEIDALIARWATARRGANGGVSFSSQSIEVRELGTVEGHLLIEGRNAAAVDVARSAGLPASRIDATTEGSLTYSTTRDNARELVDYGLSLYLNAIQASLSVDALTPRGMRVAFDLAELLPAEGLAVGDPTPETPRPSANPNNTGGTPA